MNQKIVAWTLAAAALVIISHVGCTPRHGDDVRVALLNECPVFKGGAESGGPALDSAIVVGEAVAGELLRTAAQVAKAAGQTHSTAPIAGSTADYFYFTDGKGDLHANLRQWRCLVVLVSDLQASPLGGALPNATDVYGAYRIYLEATIHFSSDRTALEFKPIMLRYRGAAEASLLGSAARDLNFQITLKKPGADKAFAATGLEFKSLVPGPTHELRADSLGAPFAKRTGWLPAHPLDDTIKLALAQEVARTRAETSKATAAAALKPVGTTALPRPSVQGPTTVTVSITETREGSVFWKFIGETLEAIAPALFKAASPAAEGTHP